MEKMYATYNFQMITLSANDATPPVCFQNDMRWMQQAKLIIPGEGSPRIVSLVADEVWNRLTVADSNLQLATSLK